MSKRFSRTFPKVSDALNGIMAVKRYTSVFNPATFKHREKKSKAFFALGIVCFFWGTTWIASKQGVRYMPGLQLAAVRQCIAGAIYVLYFLTRKTDLPKGKEWWPILVLSFLNFMLSNALSTWGVQFISAGLGSIIGAIFPLWLVVIGLFGSRTPMSSKTMLGLALGFTGICVIFYQHLREFLSADFRFGIFISLVSTWSWAFGTLYTKKQALKFNPYFALGWQMLISGPIVYIIASTTNNTMPLMQIPWQSWAAIAYLVMFGSVLSFIAYLYALQILSAEKASLYAYINPIVALFAGALLFNEKLTVSIVAGVCITLYGVWMVNRAAKAVRNE
ncbi:MAG: EamA family transporter [Bacteroidota bacterium]|nr:EamA family transporter [Bacteroidota bacterium]